MHVVPQRLFRSSALAACLVAAASLGGCARVYDVRVNAMQNPEIEGGHSYRLVTKEQGGGGASEITRERAESMVQNALAGHGMYQAEKPDDAEVTVEVACEVGPKRFVLESVDAMGMTVAEPVLIGDSRVIRDARGMPIGVVQRSGVELKEVYEKKLTIVAREGPATRDEKERPPRELWRVEVKVDDEEDSVDDVLPVLVGAAVDHIGTDSTSQQTKRVSDKSEPVNFVKGGS